MLWNVSCIHHYVPFLQVRDPNNQDEIRNVIQSVCQILPSSVDEKCELFVGKISLISDCHVHCFISVLSIKQKSWHMLLQGSIFAGEYSEQIINMIAQNLTPEEVCEALYLCHDPKPKGEGCMLCEFAIKELDNILEDKHNEEEIRRALEKVCSWFPTKYVDKCDAFVETYTEIIVNLITQDLTPEEVQHLYLA